jgi:predicted ATPase/transcriptional regulator with XRE-family HTH domain
LQPSIGRFACGSKVRKRFILPNVYSAGKHLEGKQKKYRWEMARKVSVMPVSDPAGALQSFATFGELLKYLRRRVRFTQRELSIAVGYSEAHISRLEQNQRPPDLATLAALFIPALQLEDEPDVVARLIELATAARAERLPQTGTITVTQSVTHELTETVEALEDIPPNNLPLQLTSFIGREREIAQIKRLLTLTFAGQPAGAGARLVTLTGMGGSGKTRLALQVAAEVAAAFPAGAWFVDLAPLADPALVTQTVAGALGVQAAQSDSLLVSLVNYTREKKLLLLLDNCEHVIEACAQLTETLLRAGPHLKVLATSRETLNIAGETVYHVPSLSTPDPGQLPSLDVLTRYEAVHLFVERAGAAWPGFALTADNAQAVAQVCQHLDGIPLAIELAAARVKLLRVEEVAARLADRFGLLTSGNRTALPRHQTLRALIDWSWELLSEPERILLRRLAVFAGGWTLAAAAAVMSSELDNSELITLNSELDILNGLVVLVNKSLVVADRQPGAVARYRLLETIRQYAREKLVESGEEQLVRNRHMAFFLKLAQEAEPALRGHQQMLWLSQLDGEHDNLRAALAWSLEQNDTKTALRLAGALFEFWHIRGYASEGRHWLGDALAAEGNTGPLLHNPWRAKAFLGNGVLACFQGDYATAQASLEESLRIYREVWDKFGEGYALYTLGAISFRQSNHPNARSRYEESLAVRQMAGDAWGIGNCLYGLGFLALLEGDFEATRSFFEKSVTILRQVGDKWSLAQPLHFLAWEVWFQGNVAEARALFEESLSAQRELRAKPGISMTLGSMSVMAAVHGDYAAARSAQEEALDIAREVGDKAYIAYSLEHLGELAYRQGDLAQARMHYTESMQLFREMNEKGSMGLLLRD